MLKSEYVKNDACVTVVSADLGIRKVEAFCFPQLCVLWLIPSKFLLIVGFFLPDDCFMVATVWGI